MNAHADFVRMGEPGLYPRGLLKDAPAPRELFVARVERAEKMAVKPFAAAEAIARHQAAFDAWTASVEKNADATGPLPDEDARQHEWTMYALMVEREHLLAYRPRSLAEVQLIAEHLKSIGEPFIDDDDLKGWRDALAAIDLRSTMTDTDPVLSLIDMHRQQEEAFCASGLGEQDEQRLINAANDTWWALLDLGPSTVTGAVAYAEYVAKHDKDESAPTNRVAGDNKTFVCIGAMALERVAAFLKGLNP